MSQESDSAAGGEVLSSSFSVGIGSSFAVETSGWAAGFSLAQEVIPQEPDPTSVAEDILSLSKLASGISSISAILFRVSISCKLIPVSHLLTVV